MGGLHEKVKEVLEKTLDDLVDGLEERGGRVSGFVGSAAFDDSDDATRQKQLWALLEDGLTPEELSRVGPIATLGQEESAFPFTDG